MTGNDLRTQSLRKILWWASFYNIITYDTMKIYKSGKGVLWWREPSVTKRERFLKSPLDAWPYHFKEYRLQVIWGHLGWKIKEKLQISIFIANHISKNIVLISKKFRIRKISIKNVSLNNLEWPPMVKRVSFFEKFDLKWPKMIRGVLRLSTQFYIVLQVLNRNIKYQENTNDW